MTAYKLKIIGVILMAFSFLSSFFILANKAILLPDGEIIDAYLLSRTINPTYFTLDIFNRAKTSKKIITLLDGDEKIPKNPRATLSYLN